MALVESEIFFKTYFFFQVRCFTHQTKVCVSGDYESVYLHSFYLFFVASKLYGVNATIIIFVFVLFFIVFIKKNRDYYHQWPTTITIISCHGDDCVVFFDFHMTENSHSNLPPPKEPVIEGFRRYSL